jgi:hypothetical protein
MLRSALRKNLGLRQQLEKNLLGDDGDVWERELKKFLRREPCWLPKPKTNGRKILPPRKFVIDRTQPFDPMAFIGQNWTIWKGPADGDGLTGKEAQDARSLAITELDISKLTEEGNFLTGLEGSEFVIMGEKRLARLIAKTVLADAKIAEVLFKEEGKKTLHFLHDTLGVTCVEFLGTILRAPNGNRCALNLSHRFGDDWSWGFCSLGLHRSPSVTALGFEISPQN